MVEFLIYAGDHAEGVLSEVVPDETRHVWPELPPRSLAASAPDAMQSLFVEASVAESAGALRAAGALYRAAVEELAKDQGATAANLYDKIESLRGKIEDELIDDLHEARLLGNWSLHEGLAFSAEEVADVAELIVEAVHTLYVEPAERRALRDARKARRDAHKGS